MILKMQSTKFDFSIIDSKSNIGLKKGDSWCSVKISVHNDEINFSTTKDALSVEELENLIKEFKLFMDEKKARKKRVAFTKNFFVLFLRTDRKKNKTMKLKLVHIDDNAKNYMLEFNQEEIIEFIDLIELFYQKIIN